jgi:hypothetical protein
MGSRLIETGRPRTCNISTEESYPSTEPKLGDWRGKSFVLLGDKKELYHRSPSGILQRCISIAEGQELLQEIHSGGLRSSRSASSPRWKCLPTRFLLANRGGRRH